MFTVVPAVTGALGIFPMLFYDLHGKKKERMYAELLQRRKDAAAVVSSGDKEAVQALAEEQMKMGK